MNTDVNDLSINKLPFVYMPALISLYLVVIIISSFLELPFCSTEGCELAGSLMNISKDLMYKLGLLSSLLLFFIGFYYYISKSDTVKLIFTGFLHLLICAETAFLSYMYFTSEGITCIICLVFYLLLLLTWASTICFSSDKKSNIFIYSRFTTLFTALTIIVTFALMNFESIKAKSLSPLENGYTLIVKEGCKYCQEIKEKMNKNFIPYKIVDVNDYKELIVVSGGKTVPVLAKKDNEGLELINTFVSIQAHLNSIVNKEEATLQSVPDKTPLLSMNDNSLILMPGMNSPEETGPGGCAIETEVELAVQCAN